MEFVNSGISMGLAEYNYGKHKCEKFPVWLDSGEELLCLAIQQTDGSMGLGFIEKDLLAQIRWLPNHERLETIAGDPRFTETARVEVVKKGFLILSTLRFTTASGETLVGKTDKGFARMIARQ